MRRPIKVVVILAGVIGGLAIARFVVWKRAPRLMERMMEDILPQMMDTCFGQMSQERREFMLGQCRGMLDDMDERYAVTRCAVRPAEPAVTPTEVA